MKNILISFVTFILTSGFNESYSTSVDTSLYSKKWYLRQIHMAIGNDLPAFKTEKITGKKAFITFNEIKKSAGGSGGCNGFGGTLVVNGNKISITEIISTQMFCEGIQQTENDFFNALRKVNRFEIKNKSLILYKDKMPLLELESE